MSLAETIYQHSLTLPEAAAREALDFIEFLEQRYGQAAASGTDDVNASVLDETCKAAVASPNNRKFAAFPDSLKLSRDEINDRRPDYLTIAVDEIIIPPRDQRYER